jgi:hypothetical protein
VLFSDSEVRLGESRWLLTIHVDHIGLSIGVPNLELLSSVDLDGVVLRVKSVPKVVDLHSEFITCLVVRLSNLIWLNPLLFVQIFRVQLLPILIDRVGDNWLPSSTSTQSWNGSLEVGFD